MAFQHLDSRALDSEMLEAAESVFGNRHHTESMFQILIVLSSDAEARKTLSADHAMSDSPAVCPSSVLTIWPL
jgi:hypothetical protein